LDKIAICGGKPLEGTVEVGGSKNDAVAIMAGTLLIEGKTVLHNVPRISDVYTLLNIFRHLGATSHFRQDGALEIDATNLSTSEAPQELVRQMRASFNILGALLARFGHAAVAMPGGCNIGARPVNFHIKRNSLWSMASIWEKCGGCAARTSIWSFRVRAPLSIS
jgi:UDP-N-acetylglucosamine 1-carboxyvinyltransferase